MKSKLITIIGLLTMSSIILFAPYDNMQTEVKLAINIFNLSIGMITGIHLRHWCDHRK